MLRFCVDVGDIGLMVVLVSGLALVVLVLGWCRCWFVFKLDWCW